MTSRETEKQGLAILGINYSGADPNAALVVDGQVAAAVEEERFVREKHASGRFPAKPYPPWR